MAGKPIASTLRQRDRFRIDRMANRHWPLAMPRTPRAAWARAAPDAVFLSSVSSVSWLPCLDGRRTGTGKRIAHAYRTARAVPLRSNGAIGHAAIGRGRARALRYLQSQAHRWARDAGRSEVHHEEKKNTKQDDHRVTASFVLFGSSWSIFRFSFSANGFLPNQSATKENTRGWCFQLPTMPERLRLPHTTAKSLLHKRRARPSEQFFHTLSITSPFSLSSPRLRASPFRSTRRGMHHGAPSSRIPFVCFVVALPGWPTHRHE